MEEKIKLKIKLGESEIDIEGLNEERTMALFEKLYNKLNVGVTSSLDSTDSLDDSVPKNPISSKKTIDNKYQDFLRASELSYNDLENVYHFDADSFKIIRKLNGKDSERQKVVAKLVLIAEYYLNGVEKLTGKAIGKHCKYLNIGNMGNLAVNLKNENRYFAKIGSEYKLTPKGREDALDLLRNLIYEE